jgi:hypothetical protein
MKGQGIIMKKVIGFVLLNFVCVFMFVGCKPTVIGVPIPCGDPATVIATAVDSVDNHVIDKATWTVKTSQGKITCPNTGTCTVTVPSCSTITGKVTAQGYEKGETEGPVEINRNIEVLVKLTPKK